MGFGAVLTDAAGVPFYIQDTMPLSLIAKNIYSVGAASGEGGTLALYPNDGSVRFTFVNSDAPLDSTENCEAMFIDSSNNYWSLRYRGPARNITVFIFGYQYQPVPAWGIQINDNQGRCILTNETKVLASVANLGNPSDDANSGRNLSQDLSGQWAVAPAMTGYFAGVVNQGNQPRPVIAKFFSSARFNGSTTRIKSGYLGNLETASSVTNYNYRNVLTAVNVSRY